MARLPFTTSLSRALSSVVLPGLLLSSAWCSARCGGRAPDTLPGAHGANGEDVSFVPGALDTTPTAMRAHPRLILTSTHLTALKAKAQANDPDWAKVKQLADNYATYAVADYSRDGSANNTISYNYEGLGWLDAIMPLGLAYQVTGDAKYGAKLKQILTKMAAAGADPIKVDSGFPSRSAAYGLALAYDWAYDQLDASLKQAVITTFNSWYDWYKASAYQNTGPAYGNYFGGHILGFGAGGLATAGDNSRAAEITTAIRKTFDDQVGTAFKSGGFAGGYPLEAYVYGTNHFGRLLHYMLLLRTAAGEDLLTGSDYARKCATNLLYSLKPNRWQVPDEGDYSGDTTGVMGTMLPLLLSHLLDGQSEGKYVQFLLQNKGTPPSDAQVTDTSAVERLLYADPKRASQDYRTVLPTYFHSPGDEHLLMRSGWDDNAVWGSFNADLQQWIDHQAKLAGHLAIQRGNDYLMVFGGQWKGKTGVVGQPQMFELTSAFGNTLYVEDGGAYLYTGDQYKGGQTSFGKNQPYPFAQTNDFTWAKADLTPAYDRNDDKKSAANRSVQHWIRNFAYLSPGTFVLWDRVQMLKDSYTKTLRFFLNGTATPTVSGTSVSTTVGASKLAMKTLLPTNATLTLGWEQAKGTNMVPRVELTAPGAQMDTLTVLSALDKAAATPDTSVVTVEGSVMTGALIKGGARDQVVLFGSAVSDTVGATTTVKYNVGSGAGRHYLFDLPPNQAYGVAIASSGSSTSVTVAPGGSGTSLKTTPQGVLVFDVSGGAAKAPSADPVPTPAPTTGGGGSAGASMSPATCAPPSGTGS